MKSFHFFHIWMFFQFVAFVNGVRGTFGRYDDDKFQMLIAGGITPTNAQYVKYLVSIRTLNYINYQGDNHFCTGIIITSRTILTAAHCVTDSHTSVMHPRGLLIVFGNVYRLENYRKDEARHVDKILIHQKYKRLVNYDVAVLRLSQRIPSNFRNVKPIVQRKRLNLPVGMKCTTLGWGQVYPHGPYANEVMYLEVRIREPKHCADLDYFTPDGNICVEPDEKGEICPGDMGGPLMCEDILAGIIGGSKGCQGKNSMKFINFSTVDRWVEKTVIALSGNRGTISLLLLGFCQIDYLLW